MQIQPTAHHLEQLQSALLDAFDYASLTRLVRFGLELDLEWITLVQGNRNSTTIVDEFVAYCANMQGGLKRLLAIACEQNPSNTQLATLARDWADLEFVTIPVPENHPAIQVAQRGVATAGDIRGSVIGEGNTVQQVETGGGSSFQGNVEAGNDVVGRDKYVTGDDVQGSKYEFHIGQIIQNTQQTTFVPESEEPAPGDSPYKGLMFFDVGDRSLFFGREKLTAQMVDHLRHNRFLAIVGASGSGKSSLVRAGLVPALQQGVPLADGKLPLDGSSRWPIHIITPTTHPLKALAISLTREIQTVSAAATLMDDLATDRRCLDLYVNKLLNQRTSITPYTTDRLVLVVDQFEELFTQCRDKSERQYFIGNLLAATELGEQTIVVITLRADFYAQCAEFVELRHALEISQKYIGPMTQMELKNAIEEPAHQEGWQLEPGLAELMLQDVGEEPGAMPLLSHALLETWKRRRGRKLTLSGYTQSGRVYGAIAKTAETVYQQLTLKQQYLARNIFLRLTELGEGSEDTRRRVPTEELSASEEQSSEIHILLNRLADARLITTDQGNVEVAHEALIREWPTLREWLQDDREGLRIHRRLTEAAQEWIELNRDDGALFRGTRLEATRDWANQNPTILNERETEFLSASKVAVDAEIKAKEDAKKREIEQAKALAREATEREQDQIRSNWRLRRYLLAIALMFFLAVGATGYVFYQSQLLRDQATQLVKGSRRALAGRLAAQSQFVRTNGEDVSGSLPLLLAIQAVSTTLQSDGYVLNEADSALRQAIESASSWQTNLPFIQLSYEKFKSADISPDKTKVVYVTDVGWRGGDALVWNIGATDYRNEIHRLKRQNNIVYSAHFSPDGKTLITSRNNGSAGLWDVETAQEMGTIDGPPPQVNFVTFSPDGKLIAVVEKDNARFLDSVTGRDIHKIVWTPKEWNSGIGKFSPDGLRFATSSKDGMQIWSTETWELERNLMLSDRWITSIEFSPNGRLLLALSYGGPQFWDVESGLQISLLNNDAIRADLAAFSPDGQSIATSDNYGIVHLLDIKTKTEIRRFEGNSESALSLRFNHIGDRILTTSKGIIRIWDTATGKLLQTLSESDPGIANASFQPKGDMVVFTEAGGIIHLFDLKQSKEIITFKTNTLDVNSIEFSPNGKQMVIVGRDGSIRLWDIDLRKEIRRFDNLTAFVRDSIFDPRGKIIATARSDAAISLWERDTSQQIRLLIGHQAPVNTVEFSADGQKIISASDDNTARLWDVETGKQLLIFQGHSDAVTSASFGVDDQLVVTTSADKSVRIWDVNTGKQLHILTGHKDTIRTARFDAAGHYVITASYDGTARLWKVDTGKEVLLLQEPYGNAMLSADFTPDGKNVITSSFRKVCVWGIATGTIQHCDDVHTDWVWSVNYSKNKSTFVTASSDGSIRTWDANNGKQIQRMEGRNDFFLTAKFSPDGKMIATGSKDGNAGLWDVKTGEIVRLFQGSNASITNVEFSPDGHKILTLSSDNLLRFWDVESGKEIPISPEKTSGISNANFSLDGNYIITNGFQGACIWDINFSKSLFCTNDHTNLVVAARLRSDGLLVSASFDGTVRFWEAGSGKEVRKLTNMMQPGDIVNLSHDGHFLIVAREKVVHILDLDQGIEIRTLVGHLQPLISAEFSQDDSMIVSTGADSYIRLWSNLVQDTNIRLLKDHGNLLQGHTGGVLSAAFSPDGQTILTASDDSIARLWSVRTGEQIQQFSVRTSGDFAAFSPNGRTIALGTHTGIVLQTLNSEEQKDLEVGSNVKPIKGAFSPDGKLFVTADRSSVRYWDVDTGKQLRQLRVHPGPILSVSFSPDGKALLTTYRTNTARIWDIATSQPMQDFVGHTAPVLSGVFSPDGKSILTASDDGTTRIWDVATGNQVHIFLGHQDKVRSAIFTPDGLKVITVSDDHTARIWDVATETQIRILEGHTAEIWSVAIDPKGELIVTGGRDNVARIWVARIEDLLSIANSLVEIQRNSPTFTNEEIERFGIEDK